VVTSGIEATLENSATNGWYFLVRMKQFPMRMQKTHREDENITLNALSLHLSLPSATGA